MTVQTVLGPVPADGLGVVLMHEHLAFDFTCYFDPGDSADPARRTGTIDGVQLADLRTDPTGWYDCCLLDDADLIVRELEPFAALGGGTVVDVTPIDAGRSPATLAEIARRSGVNVVMGTGWYVERAHPPELAETPLEVLYERMVGELENGVDGVRAGVIGEVGLSDPASPTELRVLEAAARAQVATGASLIVHIFGFSRQALDVLDRLAAWGVPPDRTVISHMNPSFDDPEYQLAIAARGAYLAYDMIGMGELRRPMRTLTPDGVPGFMQCPADTESARGLLRLLDAGHRDQLLVSHDVHLKVMLRHYGGWGFDHVPRNFAPLLRSLGADAADLRALLAENPARMLANPDRGDP